MKRYIDVDFLRKEVKRLERAAHKSALSCADSETRKFHEGKDFAYQHVGVLLDSLQQEQPSEDLEEAADTYAEKHGFRVPYDGSDNYYDEVDVKASKEGFIAGAEWQKKQMLKDAVEGMITCANLNRYILVPKLDESLTYGHKVKIIIVPQKED